MNTQMNRRKFLSGTAASAAAFTIVPRHVLGGVGNVAPSEKINICLIGCGTMGLGHLMARVRTPELQVVAVCDPEKDGVNYVDWSRDGLRRSIARVLGKPDSWKAGSIPGGRDIGQAIVEAGYAQRQASGQFKGCASYADFRELLEKEKDLDAVEVMTPDHLHATIAIAAMKKGKHVGMHKPLANKLQEARLVIETARKTKVGTYFMPASIDPRIRQVAGWIRQGAIGALREIHNWSNRPVWPQHATIPTDTPPVPKDFDWDLWLGPSQPRPYHPHYTHAVFRGWYEFGGGPIADMGHYSLWPVFHEFGLDNLSMVESTPSHVCEVVDGVSSKVHNDYSFPVACTVRFRFAAKADRPAVDLFWHDGGMRPPTPEEIVRDDKGLPAEGMMFVGDKGKILGGFRCDNPRLLSPGAAGELSEDTARAPRAWEHGSSWIETFRSGKPNCGDFTLAGPISDAFNLAAISLRLGGQRLIWDAAGGRIANPQSANKYLAREYRKGWELTA
ncbi:Gfo/Idh/MocA family oxidoreductase [Anaerobaca lacustris]|uniref:Gfo/Idh/MocA family oxidoreductase n=1 Tax=Anaerobaca lacustris TaxID=3044600 RepID=A0AAW6U5F5_9BACT|nr:Gfo/Idh/MocA family oxidoreductase [Sedimentisphaerales bacterium M17dextr]